MKEKKKISGFEKRTLKKKRAILDAAGELFFSKGPKQTSIAEIAAKASVSQVSIYNYFRDKDKLLEIIIVEHLEKSLGNAEEIIDLNIPFKEKLSRFFALGKKSELQISDEFMSDFDWQDPKIKKIYNSFVAEKQIPFLYRFIEMGKKDGVIERTLSNDAIMAFFMANMNIYQDDELLKKGKEYLASLSHLFYYGLLGK